MQIPSTFAPDVALNPTPATALTAGGVDPMRNAAPQQMDQMGDAVSKVGSTVDSIGERVQWQLDDAKTKSAVTQFMQQAQQVIHGDGTADNPGYLNTRGQTAIDGYDGATAALAKIKAQGMDGLDNNFQKMMYNRVTTQHLTNMGAVMADHHFQQNAQFSAQAASDSADSYVQSAVASADSIGQTDANGNPMGNFYNSSQQAVQEKLHSLFIATGASSDSPQGVTAAKAVTTSIAQGVITNMLDGHDYKGAQAFFDSENQQGHIDERAAEILGGAIKRNTDAETVKDVANQHIDTLLRAKAGVPSGIDPQLPIVGGSYTMNKNEDGSQTFTVPQGTAVNAAADGKVDSVTQEETGGPYTVELTHSDGSTTQYGNLSAVNYKVGDSVMQGQQPIGLTAKGGLDYSMADTDGKVVDPAAQALPPVDRTKFTDADDAQKIIGQINSSAYDPQMKAEMVQYVDSQQKVNLRQENENKEQIAQPLQDAYYQYADAHKASDGSPTFSTKALTPSQWATLDQVNPELSERLRVLAVPGSKGPAVDGAIDTRAGFILDPTTQTVDAVNKIRSEVTPATYLSLLSKAKELETAGPKGVQDATGVGERIKYFASNAGINVDPKTDADKQTYIDLQYKAQQAIDEIKQQNHGKATPDQVDGAIKNMLTQHVLTMPRSPYSPLNILGISKTYSPGSKYTFQMPEGATHVQQMTDGKMHYTDGTHDLGLVQ